MKTLREVLAQAEHDSVAIRHFNVSDLVAVRATHIYYKEWKTGVTFSHGWPLSSDAWDGQMPFLAQNGFCAVQVGRSHEMWFD